MKKTFTLLALMFLLESANAQFGGGTGTSGDPYQISTATHLATIATNVNAPAGALTYSDVYFKLMNDISLSGYSNWNPIGNSSYRSFMGIFDGDNKKITGLTIASGSSDYRGLFGNIAYGCVIKNVTIENYTITGQSYIGGLVGYCGLGGMTKTITITNCNVS